MAREVEKEERETEAEGEEVEKTRVDLARAEDSLGTDETPDYGGGVEDLGAWTGELLGLGGGADFRDGS